MEAFRVIVAISLFLVIGSSVAGCSSRPCREPRIPELDQTQTRTGSVPPTGGAVANTTASETDVTTPVRVRVYKPDGSRQCEKRTGRTVDSMERELAGIPVHHREKRSDGLMHIQVCGSPTGMINLYEIDSSNLKKAEERGFKKWEEGR